MNVSNRLRRLATKMAIVFPNEEALKKYLKEHPDADPRNHTVEKSPDKASPDDIEPPSDEKLESLALESDIDPDTLSDALSGILKGKLKTLKVKPKTLDEQLDFAVELIGDILDFDEFILGLPDKMGDLAKHLRAKYDEALESASEILGKGSYLDYLCVANKEGVWHISEKKWKEILKEAEEAEERELASRAEKDKEILNRTYKDYVDEKRDNEEVPVPEEVWNKLLERYK